MRSLYSRLHRRFGRRPTGKERKQRADAHRERLRAMLPLDRVSRPRATGASPGTVLIVGGGFAGMSSAYFLTAMGFNVTVVDAADIGGRVSSSTTDVPGRILEQGGELIGLNHALWLYYADMLGLGLSVLTTEDLFTGQNLQMPLVLNGRNYDEPDAEALYNDMTTVFQGWCTTAIQTLPNLLPWTPWTLPNAQALDAMNLSAQIPNTTRSDVAYAINLEFYLNNVIDPSEQSWLANLAQFAAGCAQAPQTPQPDVTGFFDDTEIFRCEAGNQSLATTIANRVSTVPGSAVFPYTSISALDTDGSSVSAMIGGSKQIFDFAVLAVPVAQLANVPINGKPLPATSHGSAVKYLAETTSRFWLEAGYAPSAMSDEIGMTWEGTDNQMNTGGNFDMSVFAGGQVADKARNSGNPDAFFQKGMSDMYGDATWGNTTFMNWPDVPNIGTGYSCPTTGQVTAIQQTYADPILGRIFLAGEHTSPAWFGFMEGALESGAFAAAKIALAAGEIG